MLQIIAIIIIIFLCLIFACKNRFMGEYTDYPADYAEVSSYENGQHPQSPAPYATTTLIGSSKLNANDAQRYNMFYKTEIFPQSAMAMPNQSGSSNNSNYNRSIHSESYAKNNCNNNNKVNIVENRMANTMMPNMYNNQQQHQQQHGMKIGSNKRNRLKLMKPQNIRNYFANQGEQLYVKVGEINQIGPHSSSSSQHTPQSHNGSINWSQGNFNIYENQMHNHMNGATVTNEPDDNQEYSYAGNRSIMSYMSSKDFPENV
jgi:hypothetical protein